MRQAIGSTPIGRLWRALFRRKQNKIQSDVLASGLPSQIADEEPLARFLKSNRHYSPEKKIVKYGAFLPRPSDDECSVFRHPGEPANELWGIGYGALGESVQIRGAAIIRSDSVRTEGLEAVAFEPPPRHANIKNWPTDDDPEKAKAARKEVAMALAKHAKLLLRSR